MNNIKNCIKQGADMEDILELAKKMITDGANVQCQERRGNKIINFIAQKAKASQATTDLYTKIGLIVLSYDKDTEQTVKLKITWAKLLWIIYQETEIQSYVMQFTMFCLKVVLMQKECSKKKNMQLLRT